MKLEELYSLYKQYPTIITDSRKAVEGGIFFALKGEFFDGNAFAKQAIIDGANYAVVDNIELQKEPNCIYVPSVLTALQDLARLHRRQLKIPVIGITGTNGKTTTKELVSSVLQQKFNTYFTQGNLNNHIGVPLTLLSINNSHQMAVVEMGANHPGEIEFLCSIAQPDYGLITNVGRAHLEGFGSFEGVKKTKGELYQFILNEGKGIFINIDNEDLIEMAPPSITKYTFGKGDNAQLVGEIANNDLLLTVKVRFTKGWLYMNSKLTGNYNFENIMAAVRIGLLFEIDPLQIQKGIENYTPQNNRSQIVKKTNNTILLDCYNANPTSMSASIRNFASITKPNKVLILGDMLELGEQSVTEHQKIIALLNELHFENVLLVGSNFENCLTPSLFNKFNNVDDAKVYIQNQNYSDCFILIKGSRGIKLEQVVECIS